MSNLISAGGAFGHSAIATFREQAQQGESVRVRLSVDGQSLDLVQDEADTTALLVQVLAQSFGAGLSSAVAQELGLAPAPGEPLPSRVVNQALDMAEIGRQAVAGIDFLTALDHSAVAGGVAYKNMLSTLNMAPQSVTADTRKQLDGQMNAQFAKAAANGQSPVTVPQAAAWLRAGLLSAFHLPR